jgi:thioredoxin 1
MARVLSHPLELDELLTVFSNKLVVLKFHASWCGPCKMISPKINDLLLTPGYETLIVISIDVDDFEDIALRYSVRAMPTFLFIRSGKVEKTFIGADFEKFKAIVHDLM